MEELVWNERLSVGYPPLDDDHKELVHLLADLRSDILANRGRNAGLHLDRLADYVRGHFAREEAILRAVGYPLLEKHMARHEAMALDIAEAMADQEIACNLDLAEKLHDFILGWLRGHIMTEDMEYAKYFVNKNATWQKHSAL